MGKLPVRISTLKKDITLGFDLYLKLSHKTIKYTHSTDSLEEDKLASLKKKKVRKLYIEDSDEAKYQDFMDRCLNDALSSDNLSINEKSQVVVATCESSAEKIMQDPKSEKSYKSAKDTSSKLVEILSSNGEMLKGIVSHKLDADDAGNDELMYKHAVNTSSLCIAFSEFLGLSNDDVNDLGVAGLFHDIGYGQLPNESQSIFFTEFDKLSLEEQKLFKTHPHMASEALQDKPFASKSVIELILAHEERQGGNGFPNKLRTLDIKQEVIALCSYYDTRMTIFNTERSELLKSISIDQLGNFELSTINKFKEFIKKAGLS